MDQDIGMRGVMWAFADLISKFPDHTWLEYSKWFTAGLNNAYSNGWLRLAGRRRSYMKHIVEDHNETIINYRLGDAKNAFGPFVAMVVIAYSEAWEGELETDVEEVLDDYFQTLYATLVRGYKKEVRPQMLEKYPIPGPERNNAVRQEAEKRANRQIKKIRKEIDALVFE